MFVSSVSRGIRPGNINTGIHAVRTAQLPYVPWAFDSRYCGQTARGVISKFKKKSFPVTQFPEELLEKKVEEIHALASKLARRRAIIAMDLLNCADFDSDPGNQIR